MELRGIAVLLTHQSLSSPESLYFDEALEGIGRILNRATGKARKLFFLVDELEVRCAPKQKKKSNLRKASR